MKEHAVDVGVTVQGARFVADGVRIWPTRLSTPSTWRLGRSWA